MIRHILLVTRPNQADRILQFDKDDCAIERKDGWMDGWHQGWDSDYLEELLDAVLCQLEQRHPAARMKQLVHAGAGVDDKGVQHRFLDDFYYSSFVNI